MVSVEYPFSKFFGVNKSISWETQSRVRMVFAPRAKKTNLSNSQEGGGDMKNGGGGFRRLVFRNSSSYIESVGASLLIYFVFLFDVVNAVGASPFLFIQFLFPV